MPCRKSRRASDYLRSRNNYRAQTIQFCGRYWDRTSDPFHVKEVRYRCANRPFFLSVVLPYLVLKLFEVETGFEPV